MPLSVAQPATPEAIAAAVADAPEPDQPTGPSGETPPPPGPSAPAGAAATPPAQPEAAPKEAAPAPATEAAAAPAVEPPADPDEAFWQRVAGLDPEELARRNRKLANKVGNDARALAERWQKEQQETARTRQLFEAAARGDDGTLAQLVKPQILQQQQQLTQEASLVPGGYAYQAVADFQGTLPEPVQAQLRGNAYEGATNRERFVAYLQDVAARLAEHRAQERIEKARQQWEQDVLPALQKKALAELRGQEPAPDLDGGAPAGARVVYDSDIGALSLDEYNSLFDERGEPKPGVLYRPGERPRTGSRAA